MLQLDRRRVATIQALALLGAIALAGYLSYIKSQGRIPPCTVGGGCAAALYSKWGYVGGHPIAYIGLVAASVIFLLSLWRDPWLRLASLALLLSGTAFTIYLRYVEQAHFGGHVCMWCVMFAITWWIATICECYRAARPATDDEDADGD